MVQIFTYNETLENRRKYMSVITDVRRVEALLRSAIKSITEENIDQLSCVIYVGISYTDYVKNATFKK